MRSAFADLNALSSTGYDKEALNSLLEKHVDFAWIADQVLGNQRDKLYESGRQEFVKSFTALLKSKLRLRAERLRPHSVSCQKKFRG